jgi:hypothetical protein
MNFGQADLAWNTNSPKVDPELDQPSGFSCENAVGTYPSTIIMRRFRKKGKYCKAGESEQ